MNRFLAKSLTHMNLNKKTIIQAFCILFFALKANAISPAFIIDSQEPNLHVDFDACVSFLGGSNSDYSEFTAWETQYEGCAKIELAGPGHVYRLNTEVNTHSCTPGIDSSSIGMCISSLDSCNFVADSDKALQFDVRLIPGDAGIGNIGVMSFYEQAPEEFNFYQGQSGPNNYPLYLGLRVTVDGQEIFFQDSIETSRSWNQLLFDFTDNESFTVSDTTVFHFELLPYCLVGNGALMTAWDIDELHISGGCNNLSAGLLKVIGLVNSCEDSTDKVLHFEAEDAFGPNMSFIITDDDGEIVAIADGDSLDLASLPNGVFSVYHIVYDDTFQGVEIGNNIEDFEGCFELSSEVTVTHNALVAGTLIDVDSLTSRMICTNESLENQIALSNSGGVSMFTDYLVLDDSLNILDVQPGSLFDFRIYGDGTYHLVAVGHNGDIQNAEEGNSFEDIEGCFVTSNFFTIIKDTSVASGDIELEENFFCVGDGNPDLLEASVNGAGGPFQRFIISDGDSTILSSPDSLPVDLDLAPVGICLLWHVASLDSVEIIAGEHISSLMGTCIDISSPVSFERVQNSAGLVSLADSTFTATVCVIDSLSEPLDFINSSIPADVFQYVVTDSANVILAVSDTSQISFAGAEPGTCLVWGFAHDGTVSLQMGDILSDSLIVGLCADISTNFVEVIRVDSGVLCGESDCELSAGTVDLFDTVFCVGDGEEDIVTGDIIGADGEFMQLILTDSDSVIIALPDSLAIDVDGADPGICIIWNLVSDDSITIDTGMHISMIEADCFELSEGASFTRIENFGGSVSLDDGSTSIEICVQDSIPDELSFVTTGSGIQYQFIITDTMNIILDLPDTSVVDFEGADVGTCLVWGIAYSDSLALMIGDTLVEPDIPGTCNDLSNNFVEVIRIDSAGVCDMVECEVNGGILDLFGSNYCVGDGIDDLLDADLIGAIGDQMMFILTDADSIVLSSFDTLPFNLDGFEAGECLLWNVSSTDTVAIDTGMHIATIQSECFDFSNAASFTKTFVDGAMLSLIGGDTTITICVGDGASDLLEFINTSSSTESYQYVITDTMNIITALVDSTVFEFDSSMIGVCRVWGVSYSGAFLPMVGDSLENTPAVNECFDISDNFVEINKVDSGPLCDTMMTVTHTIVLNRVSSVSVIFDIKNISNDSIDVSDYWICRGPGMYDRIGDVIVECGSFDFVMAPGDIKGLNIGVDNMDGELAIYTDDDFTDPEDMIHYVEWGSTGHARSTVAVAAGLWTTGDFVPSFDVANSIYFDGDGISSTDWDEGPSNLCGDLPAQVVFNRVSDVDMVIDLKNISSDTIDINDFYIGQDANLDRVGDLTVDCGPSSRILAPEEIIGLVIDPISNADGELALYRSSANAGFGVVSDYVQWGSAGHQREQSAVFSGVWTQDDFVAAITADQSIYYDGDGDSSTDWTEDSTNMCMDLNFTEDNEIEFLIAPNPGVNIIAVRVDRSRNPVNQIVITDINGKIVNNTKLDLTQGESYEIEVYGLSEGIYFMNLRTSKSVKTKKLIISR